MLHLPIDQNKVKELIKQCKHLNIFPIYLNHFFPSEEHNPTSKLIAELVNECVQYLSIMKDEELDSFAFNLPPGVRMFIDYSSNQARDLVILERIALYYLVAVLQEQYFTFRQYITGQMDNSEIFKHYPELRSRMDDDGLLTIDEHLNLFDGGIGYKEHVLHYHQFLRRGYTSNPNFDFIDRFIRYYIKTKKKNQFRIAVDPFRIMPKKFYNHIVEMDKWFGPEFDKCKIDDPNAIGLTVVKRVKPSIFDLTNKLDRTEFYWSFRDGIKTFEAEEVSECGYTFDTYYINRYVHSERDVTNQILRHFDGQVKIYLQDTYAKRFDSNMPKEPKCHKKIKLFRIDGDISVDDWTELLSHFFKGNEMIIKYFNPEQYEQVFGEQVRKYREFKAS